MLIRKTIRKNSYADSRGFSLIEAMIAMVIMATGLMAIAKFQSGLVGSSASSKARAEAIALAQQKIDEIRNYRTEDILVSNLSNDTVTTGTLPTEPADNTDYTAYTDYTSGAPYAGVNSDFTRAWNVVTDGVSKEVTVKVAWTDPKENSGAYGEFVNLSTIVSWSDPQLGADVVDTNDFQPQVPSATGDASLGDEADLDLTDYTEGTDKTTSDDGTVTVLDGGEVKLTDADGVVLLTLEEACNNGGTSLATCTDFVKISGRVYLKDSFNSSNLSSVYVRASDAAFCAQYNDDEFNTGSTYNHDVVTDYYYFDYTCYLGGSWHGNIGIVKPSTTSTFDVCLGDPDSNTITKAQLAARRVYRGMLYQVYDKTDDADSVDATDGGGTDKADTSDDLVVYVSVGVHDALELPNVANDTINGDYEYSNYLPGHNFLIVSGVSDDGDCDDELESVPNITITNTTDSSTKDVKPFENTAGEFFCFNSVEAQGSGNTIVVADGTSEYFVDGDSPTIEGAGNSTIADGDVTADMITSKTTSIEVPYYDDGDFRLVDDATFTKSDNTVVTDEPNHGIITNTCPYNPANDPSAVAQYEGTIYSLDFTPAVISSLVVNDSDDITAGVEGNCVVTDGLSSDEIATYSCDIYYIDDDQDTATTTDDEFEAWTGEIFISPQTGTTCIEAASGGAATAESLTGYIFGETDGSGGSDDRISADLGTDGTKNEPDFYCLSEDEGLIFKGDFINNDSVTVTGLTIQGVRYGNGGSAGNSSIASWTGDHTGYSIIDGTGACSFTQTEYTCLISNYYSDSGVVLEASWTGGVTGPVGQPERHTTVCEYDADLVTTGTDRVAQLVTYDAVDFAYEDDNNTDQNALWIGNDNSSTGWGGDDTQWFDGTSHQDYNTVADTYIQDMTFEASENCPAGVPETRLATE